jgi:hypothetical protein
MFRTLKEKKLLPVQRTIDQGASECIRVHTNQANASIAFAPIVLVYLSHMVLNANSWL